MRTSDHKGEQKTSAPATVASIPCRVRILLRMSNFRQGMCEAGWADGGHLLALRYREY